MKISQIVVPKDVLIISCFAVTLDLARVGFYGSTYFMYLIWNIFLAFLPFIVSAALLYHPLTKKYDYWVLILGFFVWLFLLPNAPYMVTDLVHLGHNYSGSFWYDLIMLFSFAWAGILLAFYSLSHIEKLLRTKYSHKITNTAIAFILLFTSFGIYIGRFLRWNSWDIVANPLYFFKNIADIIMNPVANRATYIFTTLLFIFMFVFYTAWKSGRKSQA